MSDLNPDNLDPQERERARRSGNPALSPWVIVLGLTLLGAVVFVGFSVLTPG